MPNPLENPPTPIEPPPTNNNDSLLAEALKATQEARIAADNERNRLQNELNQLREAQNRPAPQAELTQEEFFANPGKALSDAIARQIAPLQRDAALITRNMAYGNLKSQLAAMPNYAKWMGAFGANLDQIFSDPNVPLNLQNMMNICNVLIGQAVANNPALLEAPKPANNPPELITPPHLRPSAPANPSNNPAPVARVYNENELRMMRENKMSPEQWEHYTLTGQRPGEGIKPKVVT